MVHIAQKTSVIPDLVRIAKVPAVPRGTDACPVNTTALVVKLHAMGWPLQLRTPSMRDNSKTSKALQLWNGCQSFHRGWRSKPEAFLNVCCEMCPARF